MEVEKVKEWLMKAHKTLDPPGCYTVYMPKPLSTDAAITLGIVHEHRFAFYYWALYHRKVTLKNSASGINPPDLITIDWHDDIGAPSDFSENELSNLDISDELEVGFYCWSRLRALNDGHVSPAIFLRFFKNVHALIKQDQGETVSIRKDINGDDHHIFYHYQYDSLIKNLKNSNIDRVFLDIDLDYFTVDGSGTPMHENEIRDLINLEGEFMTWILPRLEGMTIALEPSYCGNVDNCIRFLDIINEELFSRSLCAKETRWNR
ncbi:MAG: hypothetical protein JRI65_14430 [Deltaproteobacteria bacterium]|nr:hypothetical protein [Deltaproteobacteria bacterium]